ncbi:Hsp20/alpha crystallin family protein [Sutcliffiella deserti]|uniref:Hsp20/alpha crystallin family protein n=1 Tax=Sutcliffiella deserti TaxID=2875501 RepID=UPI001CBF2FBA|nr:Hsp20/alpha crystallin family protein [Sutcliffiella deserti]
MKDKQSEPTSKNNNTRPGQPNILNSIDSFFTNSPLKGLLQQVDGYFGQTFSSETLPIETMETDNEFIILSRLAGIKKEQITIETYDRYITISVNHEETIEATDKDLTTFSKSYTSNQASRSIPIPSYVKIGELQASYRDGLLKIRLPKKDKKQVKIQD